MTRRLLPLLLLALPVTSAPAAELILTGLKQAGFVESRRGAEGSALPEPVTGGDGAGVFAVGVVAAAAVEANSLRAVWGVVNSCWRWKVTVGCVGVSRCGAAGIERRKAAG